MEASAVAQLNVIFTLHISTVCVCLCVRNRFVLFNCFSDPKKPRLREAYVGSSLNKMDMNMKTQGGKQSDAQSQE